MRNGECIEQPLLGGSNGLQHRALGENGPQCMAAYDELCFMAVSKIEMPWYSKVR